VRLVGSVEEDGRWRKAGKKKEKAKIETAAVGEWKGRAGQGRGWWRDMKSARRAKQGFYSRKFKKKEREMPWGGQEKKKRGTEGV